MEPNQPNHPFDSEENWDEHMAFYAKHVGRIVAEKRDQFFTNGRPFHAVFLIYQFLMHAQREVRLFSGRLPRRVPAHVRDGGLQVYENAHVLVAVKQFLGKSGTRLRIMVEKDIDAEPEPRDHPLIEAVHQLKVDGQLRGQASVKQLSENEAGELARNKTNHHMLLMDESGYRVEHELGDSSKAYVNVNDKKSTGTLLKFFDNTLWPMGREVWSARGEPDPAKIRGTLSDAHPAAGQR